MPLKYIYTTPLKRKKEEENKQQIYMGKRCAKSGMVLSKGKGRGRPNMKRVKEKDSQHSILPNFGLFCPWEKISYLFLIK